MLTPPVDDVIPTIRVVRRGGHASVTHAHPAYPPSPTTRGGGPAWHPNSLRAAETPRTHPPSPAPAPGTAAPPASRPPSPGSPHTASHSLDTSPAAHSRRTAASPTTVPHP